MRRVREGSRAEKERKYILRLSSKTAGRRGGQGSGLLIHFNLGATDNFLSGVGGWLLLLVGTTRIEEEDEEEGEGHKGRRAVARSATRSAILAFERGRWA